MKDLFNSILALVIFILFILFLALVPADHTDYYNNETIVCHKTSGWSFTYTHRVCYHLVKIGTVK